MIPIIIIILKIIVFALGILSTANFVGNMGKAILEGKGAVQLLPMTLFWTIFYALYQF